MLVKRVAGAPLSNTVNAPVKCREGPITVPDATPSATPALSPLVMGIVVAMLWAGIPIIKIFGIFGIKNITFEITKIKNL